MQPSVELGRADGEITLRQLIASLWRGKWLIISITLIFVALATAGALLTQKSYRTTVTLAPASDNAADGRLAALGSMAAQFGLGSLAGLAGSGNSKAAESIAVLESRALTERFIEDNALLPALFSEQWDATTSKWKLEGSSGAPTSWKGVERFQEIRNVRSDSRTGLVILTINWKDPVVAATWANGLVTLANETLRSKAIEESERNIAYLNAQAEKTAVMEGRQTIYKLLEGELNKVMLARGTNEYAFRVLDAAIAPEEAHSPRLAVWMIAAIAAGALLSSLLVLVKESLRH
jgi:uncharacterized protein involved in exopolysaccharide biosynthesis